MINKTLDDVMRRVLNDPDIFYISYTIFDNVEWEKLREKFQEGDINNVTDKINQKIQDLNHLQSQKNDRDKKRIIEAIKLAEALKRAITNKPYIVHQAFLTLDKFGLVKYNLPNMEKYGKVIENHNRSIVEQYFLSKIDGARGFQSRALKKTLEYVKELYAMKIDVLEIDLY